MKKNNPFFTQEVSSRQKLLQVVGIVVIIGLLVNFAYQVWRKHAEPPLPAIKCDLHVKTCSVAIPDGKVISLTIDPKTIPSEEPLTFTVSTQSFTPNKVILSTIPRLDHDHDHDQKIKDTHRHKAKAKVMRSIGGNQFETQIRLYKTDDPQQLWTAIVNIKAGDQNIMVPFRFQVSPSE